jgi:hypothetical protein
MSGRRSRELRRRLDDLEGVVDDGLPRVTFRLPDNHRGGPSPGEYRRGNVTIVIYEPTPAELAGRPPQPAAESETE